MIAPGRSARPSALPPASFKFWPAARLDARIVWKSRRRRRPKRFKFRRALSPLARKREPSTLAKHWVPAYAGTTGAIQSETEMRQLRRRQHRHRFDLIERAIARQDSHLHHRAGRLPFAV